MSPPIQSSRLTLRQFTAEDLDSFAALHAEPSTMADLGGAISRAKAEAKLARYLTGYTDHNTSRLYAADAQGFIGYVGVCWRENNPLGPHAEIGWRLLPRAWGRGYATEAASALLPHAFTATGLSEIYAHTGSDNHRSQAVMDRLGLTRRADLDYVANDPTLDQWRGLVWVTTAADWPPP